MKWFFALNETSGYFDAYSKMIRVAVYTAYRYTSLQPHFIYDGDDNALTRWLEERQVKIIRRRSSMYNALKRLTEEKQQDWLSTGAGAFLRVDIPIIMSENGWDDEYVLYTDCDIMFTQDVDFSGIQCKYFAVAPESGVKDNVNINTGVMIMNIPALLKDIRNFHLFIEQYLHIFAILDWDQTAYRTYYHLEWDHLKPTDNWKPYWGLNPDARIVHFHGPKPTSTEEVRQGAVSQSIKELIDRAGSSYFEMVEVWERCLRESEQCFHFTRRDDAPRGSFSSAAYPFEAEITLLRSQVIAGSQFANLCNFDEHGLCDWRAVKGKLILWLFGNLENVAAHLTVSNFFSLIGNLEAEMWYLDYTNRHFPHNLDVITRMGQNLYRQGKPDQAIQAYRAALDIEPQNQDILFSLAKLCFDIQDYAGALNYLRRILQINPADQEALAGLRLVMQQPRPAGLIELV